MDEKITLDSLTSTGVSVKRQAYTVVDGAEIPVGFPWRRAYINSERGRQQVMDEIPEPQRTSIMAMWGDAPTVED